MSDDGELLKYKCEKCRYPNEWTYSEIVQRGMRELFLNPSPQYETYSLACKRPGIPRCPGRYVTEVLKPEENE